jgi:hypothetical protein
LTTYRIVVVIPVARYHARLARCLEACSALTYEPRIVCVVSDEPLELPHDPHFINVVTGADGLTSPGAKRDLATVSCPDADVYAYLDDDAYPPPQWLDEAACVLREYPGAAGAGGPGLTPDDQTFWERVSAAVLDSPAGSGPLRFRFAREPARECDDFPAYDMFVRRKWLTSVGGWATNWYGGEDTTLCARLADRGGFLRYDPRLYAHHYRRPLWPEHAWQIYNVGRSRGCFIRAHDSRSRRLTFAGPFAFLAGVLGLALLPLAGVPIGVALLTAGCAYAMLALLGNFAAWDWRVRLMTPVGLIIHHAAYAVGISLGLLTGKRTVREWDATRSASWSIERSPTTNSGRG